MDKVTLPLLYDYVFPNSVLANALQTELGIVNYLHSMHTTTLRDCGIFEQQSPMGSDNDTVTSFMFGKSFGTWPNTAPGTHLTAGPCMDLVTAREESLYFGKRHLNKYIYPIKISPHIDAFNGAAFNDTKIAGNFFWKYMSSEALDDARNGRALIVLDYAQENFVAKSSYENLHTALEYSGIPKSQVVLAFNTFNAEEVYNSWFPENEQMLIVKSWPFVISNTSYFYMQTRQGRTEFEEFQASRNKYRTNTFLFKIRRSREHRVALAMAMHEDNLLDMGDWSWLSDFKYYDTIAGEYNEKYGLKLTDAKVKKLFNRLPKSLKDEPNDTFNSVSSWTDTQVKSYNNAYFYICTETYTEGPYKSVTEKICKPIANYMPFVFVSFPGALQLLRDMGFKTFDGFIDESYDLEQDTGKRTAMVYEQIKKLCKMTKKQLHNWYWKMEDILVHNREHLLTLYKTDKTTEDFIKFLDNRMNESPDNEL
jgi:hypothetical protein